MINFIIESLGTDIKYSILYNITDILQGLGGGNKIFFICLEKQFAHQTMYLFKVFM